MSKRTFAMGLATAAVAALTGLTGCSSTPPAPETPPVSLTAIEGSNLKQVQLTGEAVERLAIKTQAVASSSVSVAGVTATHTVIPYSAVVYDTDGSTWTYVQNGQGRYLRASIVVEVIQAQIAVLSKGPADGTAVVVVGAPELLGAEYAISGEQ